MKKIIPHFFTFLNLFCGFLSIYYSFQQNIFMSSLLIMIATIFDMLDGRLARLFQVQSSFGKEIDSFSDLITFGLSPAFLFFNFINQFFPNILTNINPLILLFFSFIYVVMAGIRLAYYNIKTNETQVVYFFTGMPSTFAGISIAILIGYPFFPSFLDYFFKPADLFLPFWFYPLFFLVYAFLMVSPIAYRKASTNFLNFKTFSNILLNLLFLVVLVFAFRYTLLLIVLCYTLSPLWIFKKRDKNV